MYQHCRQERMASRRSRYTLWVKRKPAAEKKKEKGLLSKEIENSGLSGGRVRKACRHWCSLTIRFHVVKHPAGKQKNTAHKCRQNQKVPGSVLDPARQNIIL